MLSAAITAFIRNRLTGKLVGKAVSSAAVSYFFVSYFSAIKLFYVIPCLMKLKKREEFPANNKCNTRHTHGNRTGFMLFARKRPLEGIYEMHCCCCFCSDVEMLQGGFDSRAYETFASEREVCWHFYLRSLEVIQWGCWIAQFGLKNERNLLCSLMLASLRLAVPTRGAAAK